jgi:hypothetical protein
MSSEPTWDLEAVYDAEISPLMTQIIAICKRVGLPMVASFQYANREDEALCTTALPLRPAGSSPTIEAAGPFIRRHGKPAPLMLTTRDGEGRIVASEVILP